MEVYSNFNVCFVILFLIKSNFLKMYFSILDGKVEMENRKDILFGFGRKVY